MSEYSPYIYQINEFSPTTINNWETDLFSYYTLITKPTKRNTYKISLAQMIKYCIDFGIGYDSVCITTVTTQQQFHSTMYVNRHYTTDGKRPATVADLKKKIYDIVKILIRETVKKNAAGVPTGLLKRDTIYPKYIFTLDSDLNTDKLKLLTGKTYEKQDNFSDFPFTKSTSSTSIITYSDGYVPSADTLMCPRHDHDKKVSGGSISYSCKPYVKSSSGNIIWADHLFRFGMSTAGGWTDEAINPSYHGTMTTAQVSSPEYTGSGLGWEYPDSTVSCAMSDNIPPAGARYNGSSSIRYPGRKYILFKRTN